MGFGYVVLGGGERVLLCFLWGVVGVGNLSCIGQSSLKTEGSTSLQVTAFVEFVYSWRLVCDFNFFFKHPKFMPNLYTYHVVS